MNIEYHCLENCLSNSSLICCYLLLEDFLLICCYLFIEAVSQKKPTNCIICIELNYFCCCLK